MNDILLITNINTTTDQELVELAGLHAYVNYREEDRFSTNSGTEFEVYDINYEHPTGLDAMTVKDLNTGEYVMEFQLKTIFKSKIVLP